MSLSYLGLGRMGKKDDLETKKKAAAMQGPEFVILWTSGDLPREVASSLPDSELSDKQYSQPGLGFSG